MTDFDVLVQAIALGMGVAWASGINLYAAILVLGLLSVSGNMELPPTLEVLNNPLVLSAAGVMFFIEFFADKIPGIDSGWDSVQTFVRIPAGALLAAGAMGDVTPAVSIAAGILGGGVSAATHATKAGTRLMINTSPEPVSNWVASFSEDALVVVGLWTALNHPWLFLALLLVFIVFVAWFLPKLWRGIAALGNKVVGLFRSQTATKEELAIKNDGEAVAVVEVAETTDSP